MALRREHPHFYDQYLELRLKYGMPFGPPFDPRRVPIFLGPVYTHLEEHNYRFDYNCIDQCEFNSQFTVNFEAASPDENLSYFEPTALSRTKDGLNEINQSLQASENLEPNSLLSRSDVEVDTPAEYGTASQRISELMSPTKMFHRTGATSLAYSPRQATHPLSQEWNIWTANDWGHIPSPSHQPSGLSAPFAEDDAYYRSDHHDNIDTEQDARNGIVTHGNPTAPQTPETTKNLSIHYFGSQRIVRRH